jgi:hypothetical protein
MAQGAAPGALARKERSEALLRSQGVPVNSFLPAIEDVGEFRPRTRDEIAHRAMALLAVAVKAEGMEQSRMAEIVREYDLGSLFTPEERAFIGDPRPSQHDRTQFVWRYEAAWVLLWALGYVESLDKPEAVCDVSRAVKTLTERGRGKFIADAKLRPVEDIVEQADRIYRYHWAVVDARLGGRAVPGLDSSVTLERHTALNWLVRYMDAEWDDVSTDT